MIFTLEALRARFGDSLLLHYGDKKAPKLIVIDGGPAGVYPDSLRPRLDQLRKGQTLPIQLLMVSHIDGDHISGVIALTQDMIAAQGPRPYQVVRLWHNSFDDVLGNGLQTLSAALSSAVQAASTGSPVPAHVMSQLRDDSVLADVADVGHGQTLRDNAKRLGLQVNAPFKGLVMAPAKGAKVVDVGDGLTLNVVGPDKARLEELRAKWDETVAAMQAKQKKEAEALAADFLDKSAPNLSSIVVLAEADTGGGQKKTMLLTGDARGDFVRDGLKRAGLMQGGKLHVDLFKLPHHGSDRNVDEQLFREITADNYVVSADGTYGNPDLPTLQWISNARGQDKFTIHLTNHEPRLQDFFDAEKAKGKKYKVVFRKPDALSVTVKLGE